MNNPFVSREKKAMRAKLALRQCVRSMQKWEKTLEKKKQDMIRLGQEAKRQGIKDQYLLALKGLKMIMGQQLRAKKMQMQLQLVETMRDLAQISSGYVGLMGKIGKEVGKVAGRTDFVKNQIAFENGMFSIEGMMDQMDGFLSDSDETIVPAGQQEGVSDEEIERLFNLEPTQAAPEDSRLKELGDMLTKALNSDKTEG